MDHRNSGRQKPRIFIFVNEGSRATSILTNFIAKNIDKINQRVIVKIVKINKRNFHLCERMNVKVAPTLVHGDRRITGIDNIIRVLSPPEQSRDSFGQGYMSADEYVHSYQDSVLNNGGDDDDDDDEMSPGVRDQVIKQKMADLQKRRPQMSENVEVKQRLSGGRKTRVSAPKQSSFENDDDFYRASGIDNMEGTPSQNYMDDTDGDLILEEWYLQEANNSGKKVGKTVSKKR